MFTRRWAPRRSPSAPGASCWPPARRCASARSRRATSSPRRRRRSPGSPRDGRTNPEIGARAVHQPAHRRVAPAQGLHQARHPLAQGPPRALPDATRATAPAVTRGTRPGVPGGDEGAGRDGSSCPLPPRREAPHAPHDRARPRRLRRVVELGPRHRSLLERRATLSIAAANPLRGLAADAASVTDLVRTIDGPVVLVGHSYGGAVITNVDPDAGDITGLVYVAGFAPEPGESAFSLAGSASRAARSATRCSRCPAATARPTCTINRDRFHEQFCADVPAPQAARMAATQRPVTQEALQEPSGRPAAVEGDASWFVFGEEDRNIPARAPALHGPARRGPPHDRDPGRLARRRRRAPRRDRAPDPRGRAPRARLADATTEDRRCPSHPCPRRSFSSPRRRSSPTPPPSRRSSTSSAPDGARKVLDDVQAAPIDKPDVDENGSPSRAERRRRARPHRQARRRRRDRSRSSSTSTAAAGSSATPAPTTGSSASSPSASTPRSCSSSTTARPRRSTRSRSSRPTPPRGGSSREGAAKASTLTGSPSPATRSAATWPRRWRILAKRARRRHLRAPVAVLPGHRRRAGHRQLPRVRRRVRTSRRRRWRGSGTPTCPTSSSARRSPRHRCARRSTTSPGCPRRSSSSTRTTCCATRARPTRRKLTRGRRARPRPSATTAPSTTS